MFGLFSPFLVRAVQAHSARKSVGHLSKWQKRAKGALSREMIFHTNEIKWNGNEDEDDEYENVKSISRTRTCSTNCGKQRKIFSQAL